MVKCHFGNNKWWHNFHILEIKWVQPLQFEICNHWFMIKFLSVWNCPRNQGGKQKLHEISVSPLSNKPKHTKLIRTTSWQNQQNDCAPSEDSDQPGHPPSLIRGFAVRSMRSWGPNVSSCGQWRLWSDWLIWVFAGRTCHLLVLSWGSS